MWMLETRTGRLRFIPDPRAEKRPYAVLSHMWSHDEQTFQDVQRLEQSTFSPAPGAESHANILSGLSLKVRKFCEYASRDGYEIAWLDTCCIDKSSSAELSEAINSMFDWYKMAAICYIYLADVNNEEDPCALGSQFRRSRWHIRLWTLQELLAVSRAIFLSYDWQPLGTKTSLAGALEAVSGIPRSVLLGHTPLTSVSIAQRMSWASRREVTRVEDEAYALMGLFGIRMATIYGEGRNAFTRLQEEILKQLPDQSIFLWGPILRAPRLPNFLATQAAHAARVDLGRERSLLATSPADFKHSGNIHHRPYKALVERLGSFDITHPDYVVTSYGIRTRLPVYTANSPDISIQIAVLACSFDDDDFIGLLLQPDEEQVLDGCMVGAIALHEDKLHTPRRLPGGSIIHRAVRLSADDLARLGRPIATPLHILSQNDAIATTSGRLCAPRFEPDWADPATYTYRVLYPKWRRTQLGYEGYSVFSKVVAGFEGMAGPAYAFFLRHGSQSDGSLVTIRIGPCQCAFWPRREGPWQPPHMCVSVSASRSQSLYVPKGSSTPDVPASTTLSSDMHTRASVSEGNSRGSPSDPLGSAPPSWHADDHFSHVTAQAWGYADGSDKPATRQMSCHDTHCGELVAEVVLSIDPNPNVTPTSPNPWEQIYTLDIRVVYFAGVTDRTSRVPRFLTNDSPTTASFARTWGYDPKKRQFILTQRGRRPRTTPQGETS